MQENNLLYPIVMASDYSPDAVFSDSCIQHVFLSSLTLSLIKLYSFEPNVYLPKCKPLDGRNHLFLKYFPLIIFHMDHPQDYHDKGLTIWTRVLDKQAPAGERLGSC